jgi:hypothetical protein
MGWFFRVVKIAFLNKYLLKPLPYQHLQISILYSLLPGTAFGLNDKKI